VPDHGGVAEPCPGRAPWRHRAAGLAGPGRRYALIVLLLVALASLPTLAAISAGSATLETSAAGPGTTPFIVQPPGVRVVVVPPPAGPPLASASPGGADGAAQDRVARPRAAQRPARAAAPQRRTRSRTESVVRRPAEAERPPAPRPADEPARLGWRPFGTMRLAWTVHGQIVASQSPYAGLDPPRS
jgi:hypothetical protein